MNHQFRTKYLTSSDQLRTNLYIPLFFVLTLAAIFNSLQTYYLLSRGAHAPSDFVRVLSSKLIYFYYFLFLAFIVQWLAKRNPLKRESVFRWFSIHCLTLFFSFLLHEIVSLWADRFIWGRETTMIVFYTLFNNPSIWIEILAYVLLLLGISLVEYRRIHLENEMKYSEMEVRLVQSKLHELRGKIHPQFVFNTLRTISELLHKKRNSDADHVLTLMSEFLRAVVYDSEQEEISLAEDIRFLNLYLEIQKISYQSNFDVSEVIEPETLDAVLPNYLLQPLVEDMAHRIDERHDFPYKVVIGIKRKESILEIYLEDNLKRILGDRKEQYSDRAVGGILKERLTQLFGDRQEFQFDYRWEQGTMITIRIPFYNKPDELESVIMMESNQ
jgi:two-component system, LytTR family, sensor kinase